VTASRCPATAGCRHLPGRTRAGGAALAVLLAAGMLGASRGHHRAEAAPPCPAPRPSQWEAIRDSLWPLLPHVDGDQAWAHRDTAVALPGGSAEWCNPLQASAEAVNAGRQLYGQQCASCHGEGGAGDGPAAGPDEPRPFDFTQPAFAGMREPPGTALLYAIVTRGIDGSGMNGFSGVLSGWERLAVLAYVTQLPGRDAVASSAAWADSLRARRAAASP